MPESLKKELKALLAKHKAAITWECSDGSDTHGIYGERMTLEVEGKEVFSIDGNEITARDL